jgi:hypothetical protein
MEHGRYQVDLVDENGVVVGGKQRREIDKTHDTYHSVFTGLVSPMGEVILCRIPYRDDLPNLYAGLLGIPVATIRRSRESPMAAAQRSVARELYIDDAEVIPLGGGLLELPNNIQTYASVYYLVANMPETFSSTDIAELVTISPRDLRQRIEGHREEFAPTLLAVWDKFQARLPI